MSTNSLDSSNPAVPVKMDNLAYPAFSWTLD